MKHLDHDLWKRISAFQLDESAAAFPFSARLAQENCWSKSEASEAIREYKRLIFLGLVAGHPVAPSDEVDQVWHLHLTYTRSYWERWCGETLGKPFHHIPTQGGPEESVKYAEWYAKTLESYRCWFSEDPPKRFWPPVEQRFAAKMRFSRVNVDRHWVLAKPRIPWRKEIGIAASRFRGIILSLRDTFRGPRPRRFLGALMLPPLLLLGCNTAWQTTSPLDFKGPEFLDFFWKVWLISVLLAVILRYFLRLPGTAGMRTTDFRTDPYLVAYVRGGGALAGTAAMAGLVQAKYLEADAKGYLQRASVNAPQNLHPLQKAVLKQVHISHKTRVADVRSGLVHELAALETRGEQEGMITARGSRTLARWLPFALAMSVPLLGIAKIIIGVSRDKPVGFLVLLTIVASLIAGIGFLRDPYRSRRGSAWLSRLERRNRSLKSAIGAHDPIQEADQLALAIGLFGVPVLASLGHEALKQTFIPPASSSSSACGGGCGGDGGGSSGCGGGGGCGGCGGGD
ncbi:MAG: TIGR04222 domain-containing membrane protein [Gammaproteobacteria bacterium]